MPKKDIKPKYNTVYKRFLRFCTGEHTGDALRNSLTILIPCLLLYQLVNLQLAICIGVGILLASLTDLPGSRMDKRKSAQWCILVFAIATFLTAYSLSSPIGLVLFIAAAAFLATMFAVLGPRIAAVGSLTLILISFIIGLPVTDSVALTWQVSLGASWYYLISLLLAQLSPYRSLRYAMLQGYHSLSILLRCKASCYNPQISMEDCYKSLSKVHIQVSESQEIVRLLLLREKQLLASEKGSFWLNRIYGLIDLHELLTALNHDYESIRETLSPTGVLPTIQGLILILAEEVETIAHTQQFNLRNSQLISNNQQVKVLILKAEQLQQSAEPEAAGMIAATIQNIKAITLLIADIQADVDSYAAQHRVLKDEEYKDFIPAANQSWKNLKKHLTRESPIFIFAVRLAILFGFGAAIGLLTPHADYAYWILLTLAIVARPSFINTKQRNKQRIVGTLSGMLIGISLLYFIPEVPTLLSFAAVGLFGFFLFNRANYMISVVFITIAIVLALNSYLGNIELILGSRLIYTFVGALLAILGCYFLPIGQKKGMIAQANDVIYNSQTYLRMIDQYLNHQTVDGYSIRMARKKTQTSLATFSDTINQLQTEPHLKRKDWSTLNAFHSLAYRINALTIGLAVNANNPQAEQNKQVQLQERAINIDSLLRELQAQASSL